MMREFTAAPAPIAFLALALAFVSGCDSRTASAPGRVDAVRDPHSYSNPHQVRVEHADLALDVDFAARRLQGTVDLRVRRLDPAARELILDTRDLTITSVSPETGTVLGPRDAILGSPLTIELPAEGEVLTVRVAYQTEPSASGLQWLEPEQTAGKRHPFLFTQSQAIHARSWIPLQDTPQVRMTYSAKIRVPGGLTAVMSAARVTGQTQNEFRFEMRQAIPSYLVALGVGDLVFRPIGARTGVYAEPSVVDAAAKEFADTESMLVACEKLFGPYRWERYDLLVLPPSFPFGGMENPRLSFITPTVIAGDRSLTALIAHELAHSWSGNLVTNATWRDLWLNEGFTVFLERRIMETLYGERRRAMEDLLGLQSLQEDLRTLEPGDQALALDLSGRDPDDVFSQVPYEKGYLFLRQLESQMGREGFDAFLRDYFEHFAFRSITTEQFLEYLAARMRKTGSALLSAASLEQWLEGPGLPPDAVLPASDAFAQVDAARNRWLAGEQAANVLNTAAWTTHEWLHFLDNMPAQVTPAQLADLDAAFQLTKAGNSEIAHSWLRVAIRNRYEPAMPRLEEYLTSIGRRKLIKPLYEDLVKTDWGRELARSIYAKARPGYHPLAVATLDPIVSGKKEMAAGKK